MATISLPQLSLELQAMANRCESLEPVMRFAGETAVSEIQERFDESRTVEGFPWKLIISALRQYKGTGDKPLMDTGVLRSSFSHTQDAFSVTVGTNSRQAPLMNFGGTVRPKGHPFLAIPRTKEAFRAGTASLYPEPLRAVVSRGGAGGVLLDMAGMVQYILTREVNVPERRFMGWSDEWGQDVSAAAMEYILTGSF